MKKNLKNKIEQCEYAGETRHTHKLLEDELFLLYTRITMQDNFCESCRGYDIKCPYYLTK